jgi:K+-sensing histidine kinase KdpD
VSEAEQQVIHVPATKLLDQLRWLSATLCAPPARRERLARRRETNNTERSVRRRAALWPMTTATTTTRPKSSHRFPAWAAYGGTAALVGVATALGAATRLHGDLPDEAILYLLAVVIAAARYGRWPSLIAALLSVLAFDFFFVPPVFALEVTEKRFLLTLAIMLVVGLVTSSLTIRIRRLARDAEHAAVRAATEEMRSSLLSAVSHDLRTPLAAITGAATTLRDEGALVDGGQRRELLHTICEEADRLERLVRNLLDMTRLESGALTVKREWIPLEEIDGSALNRLDTSLPPELPLVSVDPVLFEQLFVNLLENAAKHTPAGSPLAIAARAEGDVLTIEVADRGPGLAAGDEARVFEKFFRGQQAGAQGAGLGLAICRGIVDAHGGRIAAANRPGGGALFRVTLPLSGQPPSAPPDLNEAPATREPVSP